MMFCGILSIVMLKYFCVSVTSQVLTDDNISDICCQHLQGKNAELINVSDLPSRIMESRNSIYGMLH